MWLEVAAGKVNDRVIFLFYMLERKCFKVCEGVCE
jgi:hypothetical protein